jgi:ABC-type transport system involved in cytochrome c biogenesis permease component
MIASFIIMTASFITMIAPFITMITPIPTGKLIYPVMNLPVLICCVAISCGIVKNRFGNEAYFTYSMIACALQI